MPRPEWFSAGLQRKGIRHCLDDQAVFIDTIVRLFQRRAVEHYIDQLEPFARQFEWRIDLRRFRITLHGELRRNQASLIVDIE
jgi:hypothetical protein